MDIFIRLPESNESDSSSVSYLRKRTWPKHRRSRLKPVTPVALPVLSPIPERKTPAVSTPPEGQPPGANSRNKTSVQVILTS